jgi:hypothetical protein
MIGLVLGAIERGSLPYWNCSGRYLLARKPQAPDPTGRTDVQKYKGNFEEPA